MRLRPIHKMISIAAILACAGCAGTQGAPGSLPGYVYPAPATAAPARVCPAAASVPRDLASRPGFTLVNVNVTDAAHQSVTGLSQADFQAALRATQYPIVYFHPDDGAAPESVVLVIDTSGSMKPKLPVVENALGDFLTKLNPCDEVAMYAFSDRPYLLVPFAADHQAAVQGLSQLRASGETALYDSISTAIDYQQKSASYPSRAIVVITDGMDNKSLTTESA
ncbi:MAG: VWA domain-containing protein, partial [Candidatus Binataceae bacterium]